MTLAETYATPCPVCTGQTVLLDHLDSNKTCADIPRRVFPISKEKVAYYLCCDCTFCFAPEMYLWPIAEFEAKIYNDEYILADPDYVGVRTYYNAQRIKNIFAVMGASTKPRHLDYGGGKGDLSKYLIKAGFDSKSYDPFVDGDFDVRKLGKFNFITAFEVFEHVPDVKKLITDLSVLLTPDGILMFSTMLSDGEIQQGKKLDWWYAAPRNGHISLFSKESLTRLASQSGFTFGSLDANQHVYWKKPPEWAYPLLLATDVGNLVKMSGMLDKLKFFLGLAG